MNAETFSEFLRQPEKLFQLSYQELKSLSLEYPSVQLLRQLLLLKSQFDNHKEYAKNLHRASSSSPDRRFLYEWLQAHAEKMPESSALELNEDYLELKDLRELDNLLSTSEATENPGYVTATPPPSDSYQTPNTSSSEPEEDFHLPDLPAAFEPNPPSTQSVPAPDLLDTLLALSSLLEFQQPKPEKPSTPPAPIPPPVTPPPALRLHRAEVAAQKLSVQIPSPDQPPRHKSKSKEKPAKAKSPDGIASETLAKLLAHQGYLDKAISMYQQLSLEVPEKSRYFADQIKKLQKQID